MGISDSQERYVNFYTDFAFKKLFGTEANKELLISFLNSMFDGREEVSDLEYLNVEHLGPSAVERKAVFDVYCRNSQGDRFLIEMQKADQNYFKDRSIYYSTFPIQEQAVRGDWNFRLDKVYTIGILNFTFDDDPEYFHHEVKLVDVKKKNVFYDKLTYIYLEMPKFHKSEDELETLFDKWLYAMKNLGRLMERPQVLQDAVFTRLFEQAEIAKFSPTEQRGYRESQKDFWDLFSVKETAEMKGHDRGLEEGLAKGKAEGLEEGLAKGKAEGLEEGLAKGIAEGMEEGLAKGKAEGERDKAYQIAKSLISLGVQPQTIAQSTGLTLEDISKLK